MLQGSVIVLVSFAYLGVLFAIAYYGDKRAEAGRSIIANPYIYALSLAVYCTHLDVLRKRGARRLERHRVPPRLPGAHPGGGSLVVRDAEDHPHQQDLPHHLHRRLHRLALRKEPGAGRPGDGDRRPRRHPLHLAAAEGDLQQLHHPAALPAHRHAGQGRSAAALLPGHRALHRDDAGGVHHPLRHTSPRRDRAARGNGRGDRLRVGRQAARVPGRRRLRHVRHLRRLRRHLPASPGIAEAPAAGDAHRAPAEATRPGPFSRSSRCCRSCCCRASSRSRSWRTWTRTISARRSGCSRCTCSSSTSSSSRSRSAG